MSESLVIKSDKDKIERLIKYSKFNKSDSTKKSHFYSLWDFAKFLSKKENLVLDETSKAPEIKRMLDMFIDLEALDAKLIISEYLDDLMKTKATSTVATRISAIKSYIKTQKSLTIDSKHPNGIPNWDLEFIKSPKIENKKVAGPSEEEFSQLLLVLQELENSTNYLDRRNALLCYIMAFCGFRVSEALSIDIEEIDFKKSKVLISRKGLRLKKEFYIGEILLDKIQKFINDPVTKQGPLFINQDKINKTFSRLRRESAWRIVKNIGKKANIENLHPHKFRHFAATEALIANSGNVYQAMKFTGHLSKKQVERYEDERQNDQLITSNKIEDKWLKKTEN